MNKKQAIAEMIKGNKITHHTFTNDEWMTMKANKICLEDGVKCHPDEFWKYRKHKNWDDGYSLFNGGNPSQNNKSCFPKIIKILIPKK